MTWKWVGYCLLIAIPLAIWVDASVQKANALEIMKVTTIEEPTSIKPIEIEVTYSRERIIEIIRETFPEAPNTAVAIAKCESGLDADIQSHHQLSYGREQSFGIFQIHSKDHDRTAKKLGLKNYKTDVRDNVEMARHLYDSRGNFRDWTCYNTGAYKKYL